MKKILLTFCCIILFFNSYSQCPTAGSTFSGSVCPDQPVVFSNTSTNSTHVQWDFCAGDFSTTPVASDYAATPPNPYALTTVFDGTNWYGFMVNGSPAGITRFDYGTSLANSNPTAVDLNNPGGFLSAPVINNLTVLKEGSNWYGVIANFNAHNLVKLDFGSNLTNTSPTASLLFSQNLYYPFYQTLVVDSGTIYIFFCNYGSNNLVVGNFGNSINNTPVYSVIPIPTASSLGEIVFVKECNNWCGMLSCFSGSLVRLDFGPSLSNLSPVMTSVTVPGLVNPISMVLDNDGEGWFGFMQNNDGAIRKLSFGNDLNNTTPVTTTLSLPGILGTGKKLTLTREGSDHYLFGTGGSTNHFAKIKFARPCSASQPVSMADTPSVSYGTGGTFYIGLTAYDSSGNMNFHYDSISIKMPPLSDFSFTNILLGDTTFFTNLSTETGSTIISRLWDFGDSFTDTAKNPKHVYGTAGAYSVSLTNTDNNGCSNTKTVSLAIIPPLVADFISPDTVCSGETIYINNTSTNASNYLWDFCAGDFSTIPAASDFSAVIPNPTGMATVYDGVNWFGFAVTGTPAGITRFDFGPSLSNTNPAVVPITVPAGFLVTRMINNLSFIQEGGNWYGLVANFTAGTLVKLDFGASLSNTAPTPSHVPSPYLSNPLFQTLVVDNGSIYIFYCNYGDNKLVVDSFGSSINNIPVHSFITIPSVPSNGALSDIAFVKTNNRWYGFLTSFNNSLQKLDFGSSLSNNAPVITPVTITGLATPASIVLGNDGEGWVGFIQNNDAGILKLNFGSSIQNTPVAVPMLLPGVTGLSKKLTLQRDASDHFLFGTGEGSNHISRIKFARPCSATPPVSTSAMPATSYQVNGDYNISLAVTDSFGNVEFHLDSLHVAIAPVANFSFAHTCLGDLTEFYDSTTIAGPAIILSRTWDFGDSTPVSSLQNPTHTYPAAGDYTVLLVSHANTGCNDTMSRVIHINPSPVSDFITATGCSDQPLSFYDSSSIASGIIVGWQWDFGNGIGTSINEDPVYIYPDGGTYTVSLEVRSDSGCLDIQTHNVVIKSAPDGSFQATNTCIGQTVQFVNQTLSDTTILGYLWDFGDATSDTTQNPSHTYAAVVATYPVTYIVNAANGCSDTVVTQLKINNIPAANFSVAPVNICEGNTAQFTDLSSVAGDTISQWLWTFGDGFTDTVADPVHAFADSGTYTVSLIAYAATSCGNSTSKLVTVLESPVAWFGFTPVCLGSTSQFTDSTVIPASSTITRYHWDFGDGDSSSLQSPSHDFVTSGSHPVTLTVETNFGCTSQVSRLVTVHAKPVASFDFTNPCSHYPIDFNSTSSVAVPYTINSYQWNFGDPASGSNNTSTLPAPSHSYDTTIAYPVTLIVTTDAGCLDTTFQVLMIKQSSIVNFQYSPTCRGDYTDFANLSTPPSIDTAWFWKFGDGQFSLLREPAHYYISAGQYQVTLTATASNGCVSEATKTVTVSPIPVADFVNAPICIGVPYQFQDNSSIAQGSALASWKWVVSGLDSSSLQNPVFTFPDTGSYLVTLSVTSTDSCKKSVTKTVKVYPLPVANFVFNPQYGNPPLVVNFSNLTTGASTYQWNFGNGMQSTLVNPTNTYQDTGQYFIELVSRSNAGCYDTAVKSIYVIKPLLDLAIRNIYSHILDNHLYLSAEVINLGTRDVNSFNISADVDNGHSIRETYTGFLPNGSAGILLYDFNASFELTPGQDIHYFCIRVSEPNGEADNAPANNEKCNSLESSFSIKDPYPNPFTSSLSVEIILPYSDVLTVELFEISGKKVMDLYNGNAAKGLTTMEADLRGLAAGVYYLKCTFRDEVLVRPVLKSNKRK